MICPSCGTELNNGQPLCSHHASNGGEDWATSNRIMCAFIHRGEIPARVAPADREQDYGTSDGWAG